MAKDSKEKRRAAWISLLAALLLTLVKLLVALSTQSLAVLSEALHSGLDILASGLTLFAVSVSSKPADAEHAFGHGKAENLSALAQTALLVLTCLLIGWEAISRLWAGESPVRPSAAALFVMLFSIAIDVNRVRVLRKVAQKHNSQALLADALHFSSDIISSAVVLAGVFLSWIATVIPMDPSLAVYFNQADTVAALLVAVFILTTSLRMAASSVTILMDASPPALREAVHQALAAVPGILRVPQLRIRQSGSTFFVDLVVGVPADQSVSCGHTIAQAAERAVQTVIPESDVFVHVEPILAPASDPLQSVRQMAAEERLPLHSLELYGETKPWYLEFHVEMDGETPLAEAYERVRRLETKIQCAYPTMAVASHLEPLRTKAHGSRAPIPLALKETLRTHVETLLAAEPQVTEPHDFFLLEHAGYGLRLSFHAYLAEPATVSQAHEVASHLEEALKRAVPSLAAVTVHLEPKGTR